MPAASDPVPDAAPELPHTFRPLGVRFAGILSGAMLLVVFVFTWFALGPEFRAKFTPFQIGTLVFLWLLGAAAMYALVRSRLVASSSRLVVVNGYRRREYDWAEVVRVNLPPGAPWVTLDLADGSTVSAMGIQGSDGSRAQRDVRLLRRMVSELSR